jgi:hypothetical protein
MRISMETWLMRSCRCIAKKWIISNALVVSLAGGPAMLAQSATDSSPQLKEMIEKQQKAMEELREKMAQQQSLLEALQKEQEAIAKKEAEAKAVAAKPAEKKEEKPVASALSVAGFKFSGDMRLRLDAIERSATSVLGASHNVRGRYRLRFNTDKDINSQLNFHFQLATGPLNNHLTTNADFTSMSLRNPIAVSEAFVDFHPSKDVSLRGGKMEEVFADNTRFIFDDDIRFNGTHEKFRIPFNDKSSLEFRAGQYLLSNPGVAIVAPGSIWANAGFVVGTQMRSAAMFDQGMVFKLTQEKVVHSVTLNMDLFHQPNQIALASITDGGTALLNSGLGVVLSSALPGAGNGVTTKGGGKYWASHFQVAHFAYDLQTPVGKLGSHDMPFNLNVQASKNVGTSMYQYAWQAGASLGKVTKLGDPRISYLYAYKDANSMISQFTDDDLGTGSGVNIKAHLIRLDLGLSKAVTWGNLFFIQDPIRGNNPLKSFYVPYPMGSGTSYRFMTQLEFKF